MLIIISIVRPNFCNHVKTISRDTISRWNGKIIIYTVPIRTNLIPEQTKPRVLLWDLLEVYSGSALLKNESALG